MARMFNFSTSVALACNVPTLGAVAVLEPETFNLALNLNRNENFILTEKPPLSQTCVSGWPSHKSQ